MFKFFEAMSYRNTDHKDQQSAPVFLLGYARELRGGVTGVAGTLTDELPSLVELFPILGVYGRPLRSAAYSSRALGKLLKWLPGGNVSRVGIVIIGSRGDVIRTIPFILALGLFRRKVALYFHKDLLNILTPGSFLTKLVTRLWRRCSALVFLSPRLAGTARDTFDLPAARMTVIPNGLSREWQGIERRPQQERQLDVVFFGRWSPEKGVGDLQRLFSHDHLGARCTCHVFGVSARNDVTGTFEFHGWRDSAGVAAAMRDARLVILPSYAEAYPTVLLEAAACGTPFVTTAIAGMPDIAEQSGGGVVVEPGDVTAMADAARKLLDDPDAWEQASRSGYAWAQEQTVTRMADDWRRLLARLGVTDDSA